MTYVLDRQRSAFALTPNWPMGFSGLADTAAPFGGDFALQQWASKLSTEWAKRTNKSVKEIENRLDRDMKDTLAKAAARRKGEFLKKVGRPAIIRAWKIRQAQIMDFETLDKSKWLANFQPPPAHSVQLMVSPLAKDGQGRVTPLIKDANGKPARVASLVVAFMQKLRQIHPTVRADTYPNHGGRYFSGRGFSIDLWLDDSPIDTRGFWQHEHAVALLRAVHQAARAVGAEWRVIYNDYSVARVINQETGARRVVGLGFHGPAPLVLHFHLDLAPLPGVGAGAPPPMSPISYQPGGSKPGVVSSIASLPKFLADAVKSGALTLGAVSRILAGERDAGTLTNLIFYARHPNLPPGYKIQPHEKGLAREWLEIRDKLVNPLLQRLKTGPIYEPQPVASSRPLPKPTTSAKLNRFRGLVPILNRERGNIPLDFLLGWIDVESGGDIRVITKKLDERGYFQIHPDESKTLGLDHKRLSIDPEYSISSGIKLVKHRAHRARQLGFTYGTDLFWHITKLLHWLPHGVQKILENMRKHGVDPTAITWGEFKRHVIRYQPEICQSMKSCKEAWNPLVGIANADKVFDRGRQLTAVLATP